MSNGHMDISTTFISSYWNLDKNVDTTLLPFFVNNKQPADGKLRLL